MAHVSSVVYSGSTIVPFYAPPVSRIKVILEIERKSSMELKTIGMVAVAALAASTVVVFPVAMITDT